MKYFIKFGYDGSKYTGFQRGNGSRSIEDAIMTVLSESGLPSEIQSAARTDKGVSASGNVFSITSEEKPEKIIGILNSGIDDMFFHSYAVVNDDFNVRHNRQKHYRYTLFGNEPVLSLAAGTLKKFEGKHDFTNFSRRDSRNPLRTIDRIDCEIEGSLLRIDIYGKSFVWNQIRSMVEFSRFNASRGIIVDDPFSIEKKFPFLADPEPLVLMDIEYDGLTFRKGHSASKIKAMSRRLEQAEIEKRNLEILLSMKKET